MLLEILFALGSCRAAPASHEQMRPLLDGGELGAEQVRDLEASVKATPTDLDARLQLLGYYFLRAHSSASARKARQGHVLWIIQHRPDSPLAGVGFVNLDPTFDGEVYYKARDLWLATTKQRATDPAVLGNAAHFLHLYDRDSAKRLLLQAAQLEPECPEWPQQLARLHSLSLPDDPGPSRSKRAAEAFAYYERALALMEPEERLALMSEAAKTALEAGEIDKAEGFAKQLLANLPGTEHWNHGNAVHHGNLILGRLALRRGDLESARGHLLAAGRTPGSPQLDSFGPNMTLALQLLEKGERSVVLEYFELCAVFWKSGGDQLKAWGATVKGGGIPDFGANLVY